MKEAPSEEVVMPDFVGGGVEEVGISKGSEGELYGCRGWESSQRDFEARELERSGVRLIAVSR